MSEQPLNPAVGTHALHDSSPEAVLARVLGPCEIPKVVMLLVNVIFLLAGLFIVAGNKDGGN